MIGCPPLYALNGVNFGPFSNLSQLGMGALVVKDAVGRYAEKAGLYVLTQTSEGGAALVNRKNFPAKEFS